MDSIESHRDTDMNQSASVLPPLPAGPITRAGIRARLRRIAELDRQRTRRAPAGA